LNVIHRTLLWIINNKEFATLMNHLNLLIIKRNWPMANNQIKIQTKQ
jgi:hypothetical protein